MYPTKHTNLLLNSQFSYIHHWLYQVSKSFSLLLLEQDCLQRLGVTPSGRWKYNTKQCIKITTS